MLKAHSQTDCMVVVTVRRTAILPNETSKRIFLISQTEDVDVKCCGESALKFRNRQKYEKQKRYDSGTVRF